MLKGDVEYLLDFSAEISDVTLGFQDRRRFS